MNELTHYGVLGMKWGVRKDGMPQGWQGGKGGRRRLTKQERSTIKAKNAELSNKARRRRLLSDKDLDSLVQRLEKEKKLQSLVSTQVTPGRDFIKQALSPTGKKFLAIGTAGVGLATLKLVADVLSDERDFLTTSQKIKSHLDPAQFLRDIRNQGKK